LLLAHWVPQVPQFALSVDVFTQTPLHEAKPELHCTPHWPAVHVAVPLVAPGQAFPQDPQFFGSESKLRQAPLHFTSGETH
jgi:hypothetical protein